MLSEKILKAVRDRFVGKTYREIGLCCKEYYIEVEYGKYALRWCLDSNSFPKVLNEILTSHGLSVDEYCINYTATIERNVRDDDHPDTTVVKAMSAGLFKTEDQGWAVCYKRVD